MSLSSNDHYYLQAMGIDLYVERVQAAETVAAEPQSDIKMIPLSQLNRSRLIADICCLFKLKPQQISQQGDRVFRFAHWDWQFGSPDSPIKLSDKQLQTPPLTQLHSIAAKRQLWSCLQSLASLLPQEASQ